MGFDLSKILDSDSSSKSASTTLVTSSFESKVVEEEDEYYIPKCDCHINKALDDYEWNIHKRWLNKY
jgi:uncharacterized protein (DUF1499 family)